MSTDASAPQPIPGAEPSPATKPAAKPAPPAAASAPTYTRAEILAHAPSFGASAAHLGAALHLLGRPLAATRADVEQALARIRAKEA